MAAGGTSASWLPSSCWDCPFAISTRTTTSARGSFSYSSFLPGAGHRLLLADALELRAVGHPSAETADGVWKRAGAAGASAVADCFHPSGLEGLGLATAPISRGVSARVGDHRTLGEPPGTGSGSDRIPRLGKRHSRGAVGHATAVVAPAILTNACSVLSLGT